MNKKSVVTLVIIILLIVTVISLSYAYFTANLQGAEEATTITVTGGSLNINYNGGNNIHISNIIPQNEPAAIKNFTVTGNNTTDLEMPYNIRLIVDENNFSDYALTYSLLSDNTSASGTTVPSIIMPNYIQTGADSYLLGKGSFESGNGKVHTYTLYIYFPETDSDQNINQGKSFNAHIGIDDNPEVICEECLNTKIIQLEGDTETINIKSKPDYAKLSPGILTYKEVTNPYYTTLSSINNKAVGTGYIFNETTARYSLTNYNQGISYSSAHIGQYTCNSSATINCPIMYKINAVSGTSITNSTRYTYTGNTLDLNDTGLHAALDDYGTSYYYRGDKTTLNNNLIFAGFQWKILRINGDGTIRIIYNGTCPNNNCQINSEGDATQLPGTHVWNTKGSDAKYTGYMFGGEIDIASTSREEATKNETNSNAKMQLDKWYQDNILGKDFENKLADSIFCNDRQLRSEVGGIATGPGFGGSENGTTFYAANYRLDTEKIPTLLCGIKNDRFTVNDLIRGNGALTYPVGLITADELSMAGSLMLTANTSNYLYNAKSYWALSPYRSDSNTYMGNHLAPGYVSSSVVNAALGLRPVINLKSNVTITGVGNETDPFLVQ